ncbi:MAG TPA: TonB-dependent receptor [Caulobacterales bacterium]|nr:TonB-dependent receptor [Caulobacterales bacterium]
MLRKLALCAASCLAVAGGATAYAQDAAPAPSPTEQADRSNGLEEVVVTARRREENLQQTPISVTVLSGQALQALNINDLTRISNFTPGLQFSSLPGSAGISVSIRGISASDPILTNEPSIGVYTDGVYVNPLGAGKADLVDIDRVEVLRGPQGTLFGRNTTGGGVLIYTRRPSAEAGVEARASYGTDNDFLTRVTLNSGEIIRGWRAMLTYQYRQNDGWVDNTDAPGQRDPGAAQSQTFRVAVQGDIGEHLTLDYTGMVVRRRDVAPHTQIVWANADYTALGPTSVGLGGDTLRISSSPIETTRLAIPPRNIGDTEDHTLTLTYEASPEVTLKSITGTRSFDNDETYVFGSTAGLTLPVLDPVTFAPAGTRTGLLPSTAHQMRHYDQFSQEFQINGRLDRINYTAGLYYYDFQYREDLPQQVVVSIGGTSALVLPGNSSYFGDTKSSAAFGQVSYTPPILHDNLEVTVGVRYTEDKKKVAITAFPPTGPVQNRLAQNFSNTSYNLTLDYNFTPDLSMYLRYGTGYRAGGINARAFHGIPYLPEEATVYEAGLKSEWWDRRARFNAAIYQTDYDNFQTGGPQGVDPDAGFVTDTINAGKARYRGVEAEFTIAPVRGLTLMADAAYVDPEFKSFLFGGVDVSNVARFIYTSDTQYHVGAAYEFPPTNFGTVSMHVDYGFTSGPTFTVFAPTLVPSGTPDPTVGEDREELSARLTLGDIQVAGGTAEFSIYGQNLTDDRYKTTAVDFGALGFVAGAFNRPRVIGVEGRVSF